MHMVSLIGRSGRHCVSHFLLARKDQKGIIVPVLLTLTCTQWREWKRGEAVVADL